MTLSTTGIGLSFRFGAWVNWDEQSLHGCIRTQLRSVVEGVLPGLARRKLLGLPYSHDGRSSRFSAERKIIFS